MKQRLHEFLLRYGFCAQQRRVFTLLLLALVIACFLGHSIEARLNHMLHEYMEDQLEQTITMMAQMDNEVIERRLRWRHDYSEALGQHPEESAFIFSAMRQGNIVNISSADSIGVLRPDGTELYGNGTVTPEDSPASSRSTIPTSSSMPPARRTSSPRPSMNQARDRSKASFIAKLPLTASPRSCSASRTCRMRRSGSPAKTSTPSASRAATLAMRRSRSSTSSSQAAASRT